MEERVLFQRIDQLRLELPSWGFSNTGTRFKVFEQAGVPRDTLEKIEDAATVHRYTGCARLAARLRPTLHRVQVLRAGFLPDGHPGLGHGPAPLPASG